MSQLHVVLGASGGAGSAITAALAAHPDLRARAVTRRGDAPAPTGVERLAADITDPVGAEAAVRDADVVHLAAQPAYTRWAAEFPPMLESVIAATAAVGAKLVVVDNLYGYGPAGDGPMHERTAQAATDAKGVVRVAMTRRLLAAHAAGEVRVAIGKASDFFGPGLTSSGLGSLVFEPLAKPSGALRWIGRDDVPHSTAYVPDIARAFVTLGTDDRADGRVWHLPHEPAVTGKAFLALVNAVLPTSRKTSLVPPWMVRVAAPFNPMVKETLGIIHQWDRPFVVDDSDFRTTFGFQGTPLREAVAITAHAFVDGAAFARSAT